MAPQDFLPGLAEWVHGLDSVFPGKQVKPWFAEWEVGHILSLIVLGGTSILLNLRLLGVGLTDEPASELNRNLRGWTIAGVVGIVATGLLIGSANAERLYTSEAFAAKMVGLLAGIILTFSVTLPATRRDGELGPIARAAAVVGLAVFAVAIWMFAAAKLANPGLWHVIFAGALIVLFAARGLTRIVYLGGLAVLLAVQQVMTNVVYRWDDYAHLDPTNKAFAWVFTAWIIAVAIVQAVATGRGRESGPFVKAMAFAAILVWVMTAAAGRWLAFA
ncbi:MAG: hypothetical protein JF588_19585 [Caulobacterales bacterium]|nr:hypothetical protein [Caulobacterales bacterium]